MFDDPRSDDSRDRDDWRERDALDREHIDPRDVFAYVTLLCALQLLTVIRQDEPEFAALARERFTLIDEIEAARDRLRPAIRLEESGLSPGDHDAFFTWLDRWFLRRAVPAPPATVDA
jgi:hypothetical protein